MKYTVKIKETGTTYWYKEGTNILHCLHGPAVTGALGTLVYYVDGVMHRLDGPARIDSNGKETYFINGVRYTKKNFDKKVKGLGNNPEIIKDCQMRYTVEVKDSGDTFWYREGTKILHRVGGPAIEYSNGDKAFYEDNKLHCLNGYALQTINENNRAWYVRGVKYWTYPDYEKAVDAFINQANPKPMDKKNNDVNSVRYTVEVDNLGTVRWYKEGTDILHRVGAPAIVYSSGGGVYYEDGNIHRIGGPALSTIHGDEHYYIKGKKYLNYADYEKAVEELNKPIGETVFQLCVEQPILIGGRYFQLVEVK